MAKELTKKTVVKKAATKAAAKNITAPVAAKPVAIKIAAVNKAAEVKPAAVKKTAVKKAVITKVPAEKVPAAKKIALTPTTLIAKIDAGYGNEIYLRGDGPGLSWEKGVLLNNISVSEWEWTCGTVKAPFECKLLLNDEFWATGENILITPSATVIVEPQF